MRAPTLLGSLSILLSTGALLGACSSVVEDTRTSSNATSTTGATTTTGVGGGTSAATTAAVTTAGVGGAGSGGAGGAAEIPYPAPHPGMPQIPNNGGAVLKAPVIVTVTFPGDALEAQEQQFDAEVGGLKWWSTVHDSYGVGAATSGGNVVIADPPAATMTANELEVWLQDRITDGTLPAPTDQMIYALYFPITTTITFDANQGGGSLCQQFLGFHSSINATPPDGSATVPAAYAVIGQCGDINNVTETASHEFTEAATDPHPINGKPAFVYLKNSPWTTLGGENGDMCSGVSGVVENGWSLTRVWNNPNAAEGNQPCVPVPEPLNGEVSPYFNAAIVHDTLKASPGETVSTEVDCYSFGPLPNDMTLVGQAFSKKNLTFSFDKDTCKNGDVVTMSITVGPNAKSATDYHYTLLAQLDANNQHAWRAMVHVK
jgi:hypothetical protein